MNDIPVRVIPGLYIGSYLAEQNKARLMAACITDVLQVAEGLFPHFPLQFNYMNIQVQDVPQEDIVVHFPKCFDYIDSAVNRGGSVLVHCVAGISRSASIVLGYLMYRGGMSLEEATRHLQAVRPLVRPNVGFVQQLQRYQELGRDMSRWRAWRAVWQQQAAAGEHAGGGAPSAAGSPGSLTHRGGADGGEAGVVCTGRGGLGGSGRSASSSGGGTGLSGGENGSDGRAEHASDGGGTPAGGDGTPEGGGGTPKGGGSAAASQAGTHPSGAGSSAGGRAYAGRPTLEQAGGEQPAEAQQPSALCDPRLRSTSSC